MWDVRQEGSPMSLVGRVSTWECLEDKLIVSRAIIIIKSCQYLFQKLMLHRNC